MAVKTFSFADAIPERSTYQYQVTLKDAAGEDIAPAGVTSIALTLRDVTSGEIVNDRDAVSVKNANGGTLTSGLFVFQFAEADTAILGTGTSEKRILTLDFVLTGGRITREVTFFVRNLRDIA